MALARSGRPTGSGRPPPPNTPIIDLNQSDTFLRLAAQPGILSEMIGKHKIVVIDEIQKLPILLNEVQTLIENSNVTFLLTGSSARKLKKEHANMLGGRAGQLQLFPLSWSEIPNFDLDHYILRGGIPRIYDSTIPREELDAYLSVYLEQEIKAEAHVRNLMGFSRFLKTAAMQNGELLNYANISSDAGVPASTVKEYYSILEDTMIGFTLDPWLESKKRKAIQTAKFFFFDPGICHYILGVDSINRASNLWGKAFEQFIAMELRAYLSYSRPTLGKKALNFWRSENKQEVDFVVGNEFAVEIKSTARITRKHLSGLKALEEEKKIKKFFVISEDSLERETEGITLLHWKTFLKRLWAHDFLSPAA